MAGRFPAEPENAERAEARAAADLVARIAGGDAAAEGELVERYSRGVLFLLRRLTNDPALAEDLHQETFVVVLERLRGAGLAEPEKLAGFIRATARNLSIGNARKTARRDTQTDSEQVERALDAPTGTADFPQGGSGQLGSILRHERSRAVRLALGELATERDRLILYRFYLLEDTKERIRADLELSELHFHRVLFRARQRFRQILEARGVGWAGAAPEGARPPSSERGKR